MSWITDRRAAAVYLGAMHEDQGERLRREERERQERADVLDVCPNCGQYQRASNYGDCLNECAKRGFAPWGM